MTEQSLPDDITECIPPRLLRRAHGGPEPARRRDRRRIRDPPRCCRPPPAADAPPSATSEPVAAPETIADADAEIADALAAAPAEHPLSTLEARSISAWFGPTRCSSASRSRWPRVR